MPKPDQHGSHRSGNLNGGKLAGSGRGTASPQPEREATSISPARRAAFDILERVLNSDAHSDDLLHSAQLDALSPADRHLTTALVLGTLRWKIALDAELLPLLARPDVSLPSPVATALELGAFQLRHLDRVPAHAVLNESVELARAAGHGHAAGMVNALLRKLASQKPPAPKLVERPAQFASRLAHPAWLVERWARQYGVAAARSICEHDQREPDRSSAPVAVAGREDSVAPDAPESAGLQRNDDSLTPAYGAIDAGSRLVANLAARLAPKRDVPLRVWDACAAPGGKTAILAETLPLAEVLATDVSPRRLKAMAARIDRGGLKARVRCEVADATTLGVDAGEFDLILCDAPCSGTGTLGRNPEIRLRLVPEDLPRQAARQTQILRHALQRLAPGGRLLYSTCSLEAEENERVVEAVVRGGDGIEMVDLRADVAALVGDDAAGALVRKGYLRTLPGVNFAGDGFFAAAFERR